ncbi:hypothetical protein [Arthrobacter sp. H14]|uniref:hypothetical protein n=1 Tax=Arthrobacter sp. H14 TaxID=1312959 RepID=UPI00047EBEFD|nr:hypothetical protein [Arthrobacter sp. H14]
MADTQAGKTDDELLSAYLQDHIMAADSGAKVFDEARKLWADTPYGERIQGLSADIEADRQELRAIGRSLGMQLSPIKTVVSRVGRTLSHLNPLNPTGSRSGLPGQLELEGLHTAVAGKECLWRTLERIAQRDTRINAEQQKRLIERAEDQQNRIMELVLETAEIRFREDKSL